MAKQTIQDTLAFALTQEKTVVNTTVKLTATISAAISGATSDESVRTEIKAMMKKFIDTDWQFSGLTRQQDDSGLEKLSVTATARVPEAENRALERRSKEVSREGMTIVSVVPDLTVPRKMIQEAERELRAMLLEDAHTEAKFLSARRSISTTASTP